MEQKVLCVYKD
jgi:hypothetical protein